MLAGKEISMERPSPIRSAAREILFSCFSPTTKREFLLRPLFSSVCDHQSGRLEAIGFYRYRENYSETDDTMVQSFEEVGIRNRRYVDNVTYVKVIIILVVNNL